MSAFTVTNLDFNEIKANIVDHFKSTGKYTDWNFEGSGLSVLMDVLAYNTHYNAMMAHFSMNETFLDSAQIRGNVVSHAKLLGYTPRSTIASTAIVDLAVTSSGIAPAFATLERGTRFSTIVDSTKYSFVVLEPVEAPLLSSIYTFNDVTLKQGTLKRMLYRVDGSNTAQKFEIPDANVDISTIRIRIKANEDSNDYSIYTKFSTLTGISSISQIYFLQENSMGRYEIYFGDDTLGKKPASNNIIEIEYVYSDGPAANGAAAFVATDTIGGFSTISVDVTSNSYGGANREGIESIRYNAPLTFVAQNRAVTADDYRAIILKEVGNIQAISVWGGEDAPIPDYGKVYIAIKPTGADFLTSEEKEHIISNVLKGKNVVSITPIIVDPQYTYIALDIAFKYNPNLTDRTRIELESLVRSVTSDYNDNNLKSFDGVFRNSQLLRTVDSCDPSILNSDVRVFMFKDVVPNPAINNYYDLEYSSPIYNSTGTESVMTTTPFKISGVEHFFGDSAISGSNNRTIYIYKNINGIETKVSDVGVMYPLEGRVIISRFQPDDVTPVRITLIPNSNDLAPKRNQLLEIDLVEVNVTGEIDTIAVAGSSGAINYTTTAKNR